MKTSATKKAAVASDDVMNFFPKGKKPRPVQEQAIRDIDKAFQEDANLVVLEGPPGVGKSLIALTLARKWGPAWFCTATKQLQKQYIDEFQKPFGMEELKGRGSFHCERAGASCEVGGVLFKSNKCEGCPYEAAKATAIRAPLTTCNYYSYIFNVPNIGKSEADREELLTPHRPLLICDEAHTIEDVLMEHVSINIVRSKLPIIVTDPFPKEDAPVAEYFAWLKMLKGRLKGARGAKPQQDVDIERLENKIGFALWAQNKEEWIAERTEAGPHTSDGFALKPLTVASFGKLIFDYGAKVLLMSATVLNERMLRASLGLLEDEKGAPLDSKFIELPCIFPKENRPIFAGGLTMTKSARDDSWPVMVKMVVNLLNRHPKEKGLLLCQSDEMIKYLIANLPRSHSGRLLPASGKDRIANYERHLRTTVPTVLTASGFWEGADLDGDKSRFQIIPALPRPKFFGQVAARAKLQPEWYAWRTFTKLIQGVGRSVRHENDSAVTYILDASFRQEWARGERSLLPPWLREAVIDVPGRSQPVEGE